jgi:transcription antitermination factor NusA-like protein
VTSPQAAAGDDRPNALRLPGLAEPIPERPYGARSDESVVVGDLLMRHVPALVRRELEIAAIARRPGVLSKVAVRRRPGVRLSARPVSLVVGLGADYVKRVSAELSGEKIHVLQWQGNPSHYIAGALGLGYLPPNRRPARRVRVDCQWLYVEHTHSQFARNLPAVQTFGPTRAAKPVSP